VRTRGPSGRGVAERADSAEGFSIEAVSAGSHQLLPGVNELATSTYSSPGLRDLRTGDNLRHRPSLAPVEWRIHITEMHVTVITVLRSALSPSSKTRLLGVPTQLRVGIDQP
jgi:hypothetical protein